MEQSSQRRKAWAVLFVLLVFSVTAPLNQFKIPPVMPIVMKAFQLSAGEAGLLMSVFAVTGLILALPSGFIFQKLGFRIVGLLAVGAVLAGAIIGALSQDVGTLLLSRVIEGVGTSLTAVVAPAVIAMWFRAEKRGAPLGVWATWVPLGSAIMLVTAPRLAGASSWQRVWWFGAIWAAVAGVLYFAFVRRAPLRNTNGTVSAAATTSADLRRVLRNRDLWLLSLLFACFNFTFIGFTTWAPTFFARTRSMGLAHASLVVSLVMILNIVSCPLSGWVSDAIGSRRWVIVAPLVIMLVLWPLVYLARENTVISLMVALGFVSGFVPTGVFAAATEAVGDERLGGMAMGVIQVGQNTGMVLGPLLLGGIVDATGSWSAVFWALVPVTLLGIVVALVARMR